MSQPELSWTNVDEIAAQLWENDGEQNPMLIKFPDLLELVMRLPNFSGDRSRCNEKILEAIQMAWLEEFEA